MYINIDGRLVQENGELSVNGNLVLARLKDGSYFTGGNITDDQPCKYVCHDVATIYGVVATWGLYVNYCDLFEGKVKIQIGNELDRYEGFYYSLQFLDCAPIKYACYEPQFYLDHKHVFYLNDENTVSENDRLILKRNDGTRSRFEVQGQTSVCVEEIDDNGKKTGHKLEVKVVDTMGSLKFSLFEPVPDSPYIKVIAFSLAGIHPIRESYYIHRDNPKTLLKFIAHNVYGMRFEAKETLDDMTVEYFSNQARFIFHGYDLYDNLKLNRKCSDLKMTVAGKVEEETPIHNMVYFNRTFDMIDKTFSTSNYSDEDEDQEPKESQDKSE